MAQIPIQIPYEKEPCLMLQKNPQLWELRILDKPEHMHNVEGLQRLVWPGSETEVVPLHMLVTVSQNGGLVIGAYGRESEKRGDPSSPAEGKMIGFVYGFPGIYFTPDGPRPKHCSHQLGVHPDFRGRGLGFALKRAQWQMVRHQGLDLVTWTFDPLLSRNAYLNITRLGGVTCNYKRDYYGELQDGLNKGLITDRFQVDWWINSRRVNRRLSRKARRPLDLAHFLAADASIINPSKTGDDKLPRPSDPVDLGDIRANQEEDAILLVEIPSDYLALKEADTGLAREWRLHTRAIFEDLFEKGYWATDFVHMPGSAPRSFYVLSHGESTL
jgi:predicted GNAT superfamily acetyltransferase